MKRPVALSLAVHAALFAGAALALRGAASIPAPAGSARVGEVIPIEIQGSALRPGAAPAHTPVHRDRAAAPSPASRRAAPLPATPTNPPAHAIATAAAGPGTGAAELSAREAYSLRVRQKVQGAVYYPVSLRREGVQGSVGLRIAIDASGALADVKISESSGVKELDEIALESVKGSAPFQAPPGGELRLHLPIEFKLAR